MLKHEDVVAGMKELLGHDASGCWCGECPSESGSAATGCFPACVKAEKDVGNGSGGAVGKFGFLILRSLVLTVTVASDWKWPGFLLARGVWMLLPRVWQCCGLSGHDDQLQKSGRQEERWRFKLSDSVAPGPRERALSETTDANVRGAWKHVPSNLLEPSLWRRVYSGRVLNSDVPILLREA